jgi:putative ABC transport system substrate-binding protein
LDHPARQDARPLLAITQRLAFTNIIIEARWAEGNLDRLPELARGLARLNVNVMFVTGDQGLRAAKEATTTIPIVVIARLVLTKKMGA